MVFSPGLGECCGLPFWHSEVCQSRPGILRWHGHFLHPDDNLLPPQSELSQDSTCPSYQEGKQSFSVLQKDKTTALGHHPLVCLDTGSVAIMWPWRAWALKPPLGLACFSVSLTVLCMHLWFVFTKHSASFPAVGFSIL